LADEAEKKRKEEEAEKGNEIKKEKEKVVQISTGDAQPITAHATKERKRIKHRPPSVYPIPQNYTVPENPEALRSKQRDTPETDDSATSSGRKGIPAGAVGLPMMKGMPMLNIAGVKLKKLDSPGKETEKASAPTETKKVEEPKTEAKVETPSITKPKGVAMPGMGMGNINLGAVKLKGAKK